jgi:uncharacterized beta-barrel protein YwiB (DUF1934 family)
MTKEVLLSIRGLQLGEDDQRDIVETISPGEYYFRNGKHYFLYEEVIEGSKKTNRNVLKVTDDYMELTKKGEVNVHMVFEKNKKNVTYYYTPYGSLLMGIDAYRVEIREEEDELRVEVEYALELNNEHLANCRIRIKAVPRRESEFKLVEH